MWFGFESHEIVMTCNRIVKGIRLLFKYNGIDFPQDLNFREPETMGLKLV